MKTLILFIFVSVFSFHFTISKNERTLETTPDSVVVGKDFCENLQAILKSANEQFTPVKGAETSQIVSGLPKKFYFSTVGLSPNYKCYLEDSEKYPVCQCIVSESRFYSEKLGKDYQEVADKVKKCLGPEWKLSEQDKSNSIYVTETNSKKLVFNEDKAGKKVKAELFMYNNRMKGHWVVEFKIEGIGK